MKQVTYFKAILACAALTACAATPAGVAQEHAPERAPEHAPAVADVREARAHAIIAALSTGDAEAYERAAREHYSEALYARRTSAERAEFVRQMAAEFSPMQIVGVTEEGGALIARVTGGGGTMSGALTFSFEDTPAHKIARIDIQAEAGGGGSEEGPRFPPPPISPAQSASEMGASIDGWIDPFLQHDDFAGIVLIARNGQAFVTRAYGPADRTSNLSANEETAYNVASIGKKFTQTAIGRLIQDGRLTLSTTLGEVLPDYPNPEARAATISQLIGMRGGISDFFGDDFERQPKSRFSSNHAYYEYVSRLPQRFAPGSRNEYCNGCYVVLGEMVERLSGVRFEDYVQRHVFTPAGMTRSGYFNAANLPRNTALPYVRSAGPGSPYIDSLNHHGATGSGAGGVYSTARDLLAFDNALRDGRLLNSEMTAWVLGGSPSAGRNFGALAIAGGGAGTSNILESDGHWTVIVTSNVQEPLPERIGLALARQLGR